MQVKASTGFCIYVRTKMKINPSTNRPDTVTAGIRESIISSDAHQIGLISLGCPKALVDSERILTRLNNEGYNISRNYEGASAVIVNTCGFLDSAKLESLEAIGEALKQNGKVIVTGCLGANEDQIRDQYPSVLSISGPHQYQKVIDAVHNVAPPVENKFVNLIPKTNVKLTPNHYSYLKISEGCNHKCKFCIIPDMRGKLNSRSISNILNEAKRLSDTGVKELLIISQDTSAYGVDNKHASTIVDGRKVKTHIFDLARELGNLGIWIRLHYVYPYPHVEKLITLMSDGLILPYLDIPFQHSHPDVLRRMARPANQAKTLTEIAKWRKTCPDLTLRSTFIVGYPGETEYEFEYLLEWLKEAKLDRVGCFQYENVSGAKSNDLPNHCPAEIKQDRWKRFMETAQKISTDKLKQKIGTIQDVIVDEVDSEGAVCRTKGDAPEIDGNLFIDRNFKKLSPGDTLKVKVEESSEYDLWGSPISLY